jgi:hypothetical protein
LDDPDSELFAVDHEELEAVVELLGGEAPEIDSMLHDLPERAGDELLELFLATRNGEVNLTVTVVRGGGVSARATVSTRHATTQARHLESVEWSQPGRDLLRGILFRIDTRRGKIAVDTSLDEDESAKVVEASFSLDLLEPLRAALHGYVEVEVEVLEERRPYERTARGQLMNVIAVRDAETDPGHDSVA